MTGPKLNDGALVLADGQPTTKATAKYLRGSAYKAREVLDLIRGLDVRRADEVLRFTTRDVATDIRKVLASAVANAVHNDEQDADELFVLACYADEGPTLRRFRPRARGRATRIRKRTCHITVVVARLSDDRLDVLQARRESRTAAGRRRGVPAQSRRERVQRSRARAESLRAGATETPEATTEELPEETPASDVDAVDATEVIADDLDANEEAADARERGEAGSEGAEPSSAGESAGLAGGASTEREVAEPSSEASEASAEDVAEETAAAIELPEGAALAPVDGSIPDGYPIKGNQSSMKYHVPGGRYYDVVIAELFFDTPEHAEAAGFEAPAADTSESDGTQ